MKSIQKYLLLILLAITLNAIAQKQKAKPDGNPVPLIPGYFADPTIIVYNNKFYIYATIDPWGGDSLALWVTSDFKKWERKPLNWPTKALCKSPESTTNMVWAPSVIKGKDGRFHMFVAVGSEVYAGVSDKPEGPWQNVKKDGSPFVKTQVAINVHTIDAEAYLDDNGQAYLYWGSGWEWKNGHCFVGKLNQQMDAFTNTPKDITPPNYFEAPYMLKHKGTYFLMYSQGKCIDSTYKIRYSTSSSPTGPWVEGKHSPVLSTDTALNVIGPGHHTILQYKGKYFIIYHRIAETKSKDLLREICIDELTFNKEGDLNVVNPKNAGLKVLLPLMKQKM
ncbi:family 43 glycosylhydrolase [Parasediminibacterium sp. JCM 36343]|uniref:family 43 glycosylhydrolase n=1 Tax=Parasediminibacterium sp. JCM 36343 TaxID=3374279 RepID=UPI00397A5ED9